MLQRDDDEQEVPLHWRGLFGQIVNAPAERLPTLQSRNRPRATDQPCNGGSHLEQPDQGLQLASILVY